VPFLLGGLLDASWTCSAPKNTCISDPFTDIAMTQKTEVLFFYILVILLKHHYASVMSVVKPLTIRGYV